MMNINLKSVVKGDLASVSQRFDADLFRYLLPPGASLIEFGGSKKGDRVHLKLPIAGEWISEIIEDGGSEDQLYFVDEGVTLPFPLKKWLHRHVLHKDGQQVIIEDNMNFSTGFKLLDILFYPMLYFAFLPRTWQYGKYFKSLSK